jgi:hypothetical protein
MEIFDADQHMLPVFITTFNRLTCLKQLLAWLEKITYTQPVILDNNSSYPPLLEFLSHTRHEVVRFNRNHGEKLPWESQLVFSKPGNYYVVTDPDIVPTEACPLDLFHLLKSILLHMQVYFKAGPALKIDDIPSHCSVPEKIKEQKETFWNRPPIQYGAYGNGKPPLYFSWIDTTMALYDKCKPAPETKAHGFAHGPAIRTGEPYIARHTTWYLDKNNMTEEELYYARTTECSDVYGTDFWLDKFNKTVERKDGRLRLKPKDPAGLHQQP